MHSFSQFIQSLLPWASGWNAFILTIDFTVLILFLHLYKKNGSRILLNSLPGIFTSLGIFGTFCAICQSLSGISTDPMSEFDRVGKAVGEIAAYGGDLDIKKVISDLIPAFSTSIYGLLFAIPVTIWSKTKFAEEDSQTAALLTYKDPERAIDDIDTQMVATKQLVSGISSELSSTKEAIYSLRDVTIENNNKLTSTIEQQSQILSKFVDGFIQEMQDCFKAMNTVIESRVTAFGEEQFKQSREVLEGMTNKLNEQATEMIEEHNKSIRDLAGKNASSLTEMTDSLKNAINVLKSGTISELQRYTSESLAEHRSAAEEQKRFNNELLSSMSESLDTNCKALEGKFEENVSNLKNAVDVLQNGTIAELQKFTSESVKAQIANAEEQRKFNSDLMSSMSESLETNCKALEGKFEENVSNLRNAVEILQNGTLAELQKFTSESVKVQMANAEEQNRFNNELLNQMSASLTETTGQISAALTMNCAALSEAIQANVKMLDKAYGFIDAKSATIVSNYEQASEAYNTAVQNAHDLNAGVDKAIGRMNDGLKDIARTNEAVDKAFKLMADSEADIQSVIMRIEELGKAIVTLQKLETVLTKIAAR